MNSGSSHALPRPVSMEVLPTLGSSLTSEETLSLIQFKVLTQIYKPFVHKTEDVIVTDSLNVHKLH